MNPLDINNVVLFPHCNLAGDDLDGILQDFQHLTVGVPWFMDPPQIHDPEGRKLKILRPPEDLRPDVDFERVLADYQTWMRDHPDRGYNTFFKAYLARADEDAPRWVIRQEILGGESDARGSEALRWHLILHMSSVVEASGREAEALLENAKGQRPLLADALEEEPVPDPFFSEIDSSQGYHFLTRGQTASAVEAWLGLFGAALPPRAALLTLNAEIPELAGDLCEQRGLSLIVKEKTSLEFSGGKLKVYALEGLPGMQTNPSAFIEALTSRILCHLAI